MLVGRDAECSAIDMLIASARASHGGALVLRGEAGVGKTALLRYAIERAEGMRVLRAVGVEWEADLPFSALHQVVREGLPRLDTLPPPQAAAIRGALGLSQERVEDRFLICLGALGLLAAMAEERPVMVVVEDAQWLDRASAEALGFAARRLDGEPVAMLLAAREGEARRLDAAGVPELLLEGLDRAAARALLDGGDRGMAPHVAERLVALTGGNPLALVELPSVLGADQLAGRAPLPEHLPLTSEVERAFLQRAQGLGEGARAILSVAAADEAGDVPTVLAAAALLGADAGDLEAAEASGLVRVVGDRLELRHPLARSALHRGTPYPLRQAAHRALADVLTDAADADRRAWHLAATAVAPDDEAADALERTAERARARSGHAAAASALERAARLGSDPGVRARRMVAAAESALDAGRAPLAQALAAEAAAGVDDDGLRADLLRIQGAAELARGRPAEAHALLLAAAGAAADGAPDRLLDLLLVAAEAAIMGGDRDGVLEAARRAEPLTSEVAGWGATWLAGVAMLQRGDIAAAVPALARIVAHAGDTHDPRTLVWAANAAVWLGDQDRAIALQSDAVARARARGAFATLAVALLRRGGLMAARGLTREALADGEEGLRLTEEAGLDNGVAQSHAVLAGAAALRGDEEACRREAERAIAVATQRGIAPARETATWALGILALGRGRYDDALEHLSRIAGGDETGRMRTPLSLYAAAPDLIEAAARAGRRDEAAPVLARLATWHGATGAGWVAPLLERGRGLLAEGPAAEAHLRAALELHTGDAPGFHRARTELCLGELLRRDRRRADARTHLRAAAGVFDALGAEPWAERAREELRATGESRQRPRRSGAADLTPQERRIARFVAEGASNKEVAAQLFLSPKTVEYHLAKVFQKLGISSRADLVRLEGALS